jgi:hypothetical protein
MVGPEERTEAQILGGSRDAHELVIRGALLRFGEDPQLHAGSLPRPLTLLPDDLADVRRTSSPAPP